MAYFITSSASASVVQTILDPTGSIITSSLYTPNDPINVDNIVYIQKSNSQFPNLSRSVYKPSLSFLYNGQSVSWLYDDDSIRDSDYNLIKTLNTNYDGKGGGGTTDTGSLLLTASVSSNTITFTKGNGSTFPITVDTGSGGNVFPYTGSAIITGSLTITGSLNITDEINLGDVSINPSNQILTTTQNYITSSIQGLFYSKLDECRFPSGGNNIDLLSGSTSTIYGSRNIPSSFFSQSGNYRSKIISLRIVGSIIFGNNRAFNSYIKIGNDIIPTTNTSVNVDKSNDKPFEILTDLIFNSGKLLVCSSLRYCDNNSEYFALPLSNLFETTSSLNLSGDIQFWVSSSSTITEMTGSYSYIEIKN
jgi:hypothetical protein